MPEEILFQVPFVKYKKDEGTLYILSERMTWFQKDMMKLSHKYADMKMQKISPDGKQKIQLQIVLHDNSSLTFHFVNPKGSTDQYKDREQVKELLLQLLPKFRPKITKELENKNKLLSEHPELLQLYKDLVIEKIVTPGEFWAVHAQQYLGHAVDAASNTQDTGVSSGFLSNIHAETDGAAIRYNLTADMITSIFKTYPSVKRKHMECVPSMMTESQFWTKFFQSHYFHRDRLPNKKELFSDCVKLDDKEMRKEIDRVGPYFETENENVDFNGKETQFDGVSKNLIKSFNYHSIMVLKACENDPAPSQKKSKLERLEDLSQNMTEKTETSKLDLSRVNRYFKGPCANQAEVTPEIIISTAQQMRENLLRWGGKPMLLDSATAIKVLIDVSPGGTLMADQKKATEYQLTTELLAEMRNAYISLTELLRHYYSCYPTSTVALEEKLRSSFESLKKFESVKLPSLNDRLLQHHCSPKLIVHLKSVLNTAYERFAVWGARKARI